MSPRPTITDTKVLKYVDRLEEQLEKFKANTAIAISYRSLHSFIIKAANVIRECEMSPESFTEAADKMMDRAQKFADKIDEYNDKLEKMEKKVSPDIVTEVKRESAGLLESAIRESGG